MPASQRQVKQETLELQTTLERVWHDLRSGAQDTPAMWVLGDIILTREAKKLEAKFGREALAGSMYEKAIAVLRKIEAPEPAAFMRTTWWNMVHGCAPAREA